MIERSIAFGPGAALVGTLCLPAQPGAAVGLLLFNAGVIHRVGPHRLNVRLARALAARGIPSLRFDLAGQGDSARAAGEGGFERQAVADLGAAMDALGHEAAVPRFAIFGFCSGGVHGYAAAQADARVAGLLMYDTYLYRSAWSRVNRYRITIRERGLLAALAGRLARAWSRLTGGQPPAPPVLESALFTTPSPAEYARVMRALHDRGVKLGAIVSGSRPDLYNYAGQFADAFRGQGLERIVPHEYLPQLRHNAASLAQQAELLARIADWTVDLDGRLRETRGAAAA